MYKLAMLSTSPVKGLYLRLPKKKLDDRELFLLHIYTHVIEQVRRFCDLFILGGLIGSPQARQQIGF